MIHRFDPIKYYHTYGPNPPVLCINPGDTVITTTVDAGGLDSNGEQISEDSIQIGRARNKIVSTVPSPNSFDPPLRSIEQ